MNTPTEVFDATKKKDARRRVKSAEWYAEGERLFGPDQMKWQFVCPVCKHVATAEDYQKARAPENAVAFNCVGRYLPKQRDAFEGRGPGPCNYTGGGFFALNPVTVERGDEVHHVFEFATKAVAP